MTDNICMMAISVGKKSEESQSKRYLGVGRFTVLEVNPSKAKLEEILGVSVEKEPEYTSVDKELNVPTTRIDFLCKEADNDFKTRLVFFVTRTAATNKDGTKAQVINKYGESAWVPIENAKNGTMPENQKWFNTNGMRPAFRGEPELIAFLKALLNVENKSFKKSDGTVVTNDDSVSMIYLENWDNIFKGDVSEISDILKQFPDYAVKVVLGVKEVDGKSFQDFFRGAFMKNGTRNYERIAKQIMEAKAAGMYPNTTFDTEKCHEYQVAPSTFTEQPPKTQEEFVKSLFGKNA